ncbi:ferric-dicitrate binding protein FerR, regulates iron transport through sigma-19 [Chitinophaga eiseniae]|uniref:Ferric-dicitrate binding protein FerR, regulates iron transport through sigma-19 n=1 Tax=Chitinophaga eiseniae TaxID=634771 RepID=A0A1T4TNC8_9BACT|nr:FecR domain-containing protein [Chitinophaga eiseniae]SKA41818.1 ferric-dicitrate binding protein FerR, regulates iron transport through sigma-19 [Chitinophaga eiseniae]
MADFQPDSLLLTRYFEGKISDPATRAVIEAYIVSGKDAAFVQACMEAAWAGASSATPDKASDNDWQQFRRLAGITAQRRMLYPQIAAAATLLLLVTVATWLFFKPRPRQPALAWHTITAAPGTPRQVQLPDGSQATIFPGSAISYVPAFNAAIREVRLSGRAFFNITSAADRPFLVTSGKYTTQVLGTAFEVDDRSRLTVTLLSGKVRLLGYHGQRLTDLQPQQQVIVDKQAGSFRLAAVAADAATSWTTGQLTFDQEKLNAVCEDLQQWYNVKIRITGKELLQKRITAEFKQLPLPAVMDILSQTAGFRYRQEKDTIVIY